ncbi:MAG: hypothetical protein A2Z27_03915 [candidate division Zixibacteria bacterium RBG_16_50_21]|nr:MAG: hypothetical protein A2Z27_03915 [candidate division Zixibacteria bacterium RBG_16_50_21]
MSPGKILLLLAKAVGVYLIVFAFWLFISPVYLHLIAFVSAKLIPAVLIEDYRLQSYVVNPDQNPENSKRNQIRYYIHVSPTVRNWIQFGATDLTYPVVTFFTLMLVTPHLGWKKRLKFLAIGFVILWLFYSILAVFFFRVTCFQQARELAHLGIIEDLFGIERLARWKSGGGIAILAGQFVPVAVWFVSAFRYLFRRPTGKSSATS